jgi:hypothetical protein
MFKGPVHSAPFKEHPVVDMVSREPNDFDVISVLPEHSPNFIEEGKFSLQQYCYCLLHKIVTLNKSKIKPFIYYQCENLSDPFTWLNKLEKIIDLNRELFTTKDHKIKIEKALVVIELLRSDIENNKFNKASKFDFEKVKSKLKKLSNTGRAAFVFYTKHKQSIYKTNQEQSTQLKHLLTKSVALKLIKLKSLNN